MKVKVGFLILLQQSIIIFLIVFYFNLLMEIADKVVQDMYQDIVDFQSVEREPPKKVVVYGKDRILGDVARSLSDRLGGDYVVSEYHNLPQSFSGGEYYLGIDWYVSRV